MPMFHPHTEETKAKIRDAKLGVPRSEETKQKLREAWKTRAPMSEETREKMRIASTGRIKSPEAREKIRQSKLGKKRSPETIAKMSAALKGRKLRLGATHSDETKAILRERSTGKVPAALVARGITQDDYAIATAEGKRWCKGCKQFMIEVNSGRCPECNRISASLHRADRTPEEIEADNEYGSKWRLDNAASVRRNWLLKKYGVTPEWYEETLAEQGGHCALCEATVDNRRMPSHAIRGVSRLYLLIDHNHETGKARGLLCAKCNTALHRVEYIQGWAYKALAYLASHS